MNPEKLHEVIKFVKHSKNEIRKEALSIIAMVAQNNPKGKKNLVQTGGLVAVIFNLRNEEEEEVLAKSVYAFSALVKHDSVVQDMVIKMNGFEALIGLLSEKRVHGDGIKMKILFLLNRMLDENTHKWAKYFSKFELFKVISDIFDNFSAETSLDLFDKSLSILDSLFNFIGDDESKKTIESHFKESLPKLELILSKQNKKDNEEVKKMLSKIKKFKKF